MMMKRRHKVTVVLTPTAEALADRLLQLKTSEASSHDAIAIHDVFRAMSAIPTYDSIVDLINGNYKSWTPMTNQDVELSLPVAAAAVGELEILKTLIQSQKNIFTDRANRILPSPLEAAAATSKIPVLKWMLGFLDAFGLRYPPHSHQSPWATGPLLAEWRTAYAGYVCRAILSAIPRRQCETTNILMEHLFTLQGSGDDVVGQGQVDRSNDETDFRLNAVYVDEGDATSASGPDHCLNAIGDPVSYSRGCQDTEHPP